MHLLDQHQTAELTRLSERTLERHRSAGTGPKFVRLGRRVLYDRDDLAAWIGDCTYSSIAEAEAEAARRDFSAKQEAHTTNENPAQIDADRHDAAPPATPLHKKRGGIHSGPHRVRNENGIGSSGHEGTRQ